MAITISPLYPVVDEAVTFTVTDANGNATTGPNINLTAVPSQSAIATGIIRDNSGVPSQVFTPDAEGEYAVTAFQFTNFAGTPSHGNDASGVSRNVLGTVQTSTVYVGSRLELPIKTRSGHGATLRLNVHGDTVRAASLVSPLTDLSRQGVIDTTVAASVAALVDVTASAMGIEFIAGADALRTAYEAHRILTAGTVHNGTGDTVNVATWQTPFVRKTAIQQLNDLADAIEGHLQEGSYATTWHDNDDTKNLPEVVKAVDESGAYVLLVDLRERVYERHRVQIAAPAVHGAADSTNALATSGTLATAIVDFLDFLATTTPATIAGENIGSTKAQAKFGFRANIRRVT